MYETANMNFRPGQPFVGSSAFAHKGGMHVHGVRKIASSYEHIDPSLGRQRAPSPRQRAFRQVEHRREARRARPRRDPDLLGEGPRPRPGPGKRRLPVRGGRRLVRPARREARRPVLPAVRAPRLPGERRPAARAEPVTEATVKLRVGDATVEHTVSEGDGPVNALDGALRKALSPISPAWQGDARSSTTRSASSTPAPGPPRASASSSRARTTTPSGGRSASPRTSSRRAGSP